MSEHLVQFYESSAGLADSTARFLSAGLAARDAVLVVATPSHREDLDRRLFADGRTTRTDRYVALDAATTLAQIMVGDVPDAGRFRQVIGDAIRSARNGRSGQVRAFGEMVALLAIDGRWQGALHLEELWNALVAEDSLSLLCAYPDAVFHDESTRVPLETICAQHTAVVPPDGRQRFWAPVRQSHARTRLSFVSLVERAVTAVRPLADERHHSLTVAWPEQDLHVEADRTRLERVFVNLLTNAVRYTPAHGRIRVSAAHEEQYAVLRVRDSGAGIVPGVLSNALDPGCAITDVRDVVETYGGVVEVRSSGLHMGVEFVIRLPVAGAPPEHRGS
jgi:hypothetical protein